MTASLNDTQSQPVNNKFEAGNQDSSVDAALANAARGRYVFPVWGITDSGCACPSGASCDRPGKHPRVRWKTEATVDRAKIQDWFRKWPNANYAIVTGATSNLSVLDVDPAKGGLTSLDDLVTTYGSDFLNTETVETGSGGNHLYYEYVPGLGCSQSVIGPGLDVRSHGGYVIGPSSLHASGKRYSIAEGAPLASAPPFLKALADAQPSTRERDRGGDVPGARIEEIAKQTPEWVCDQLAAIKVPKHKPLVDKLLAGGMFAPYGARDGAVAQLAGLVAKIAPDRDPNELSEQIFGPSLATFGPDDQGKWTQEDRITWVAEKIGRFQDQERIERAAREETVTRLTAVRNARAAGDPAAIAAAEATLTWEQSLALALSDVQGALGTEKETQLREPLFFPADDLFTRSFSSTPWLVRDLITRGGLAVLGAGPKSGKTWTATDIALAVARGGQALGEFQAEKGRVGYFYAEDLDFQIRNRLRALRAGYGIPANVLIPDLHICPRGQFLDITRDEDLAWVIASARRMGQLDLLVLDPLRNVQSAEENDSTEMIAVMRRLHALGEVLGCTVMVAHHTKKPTGSNDRPGNMLRGSSAIYGAIDSGLYINRVGDESQNEMFELKLVGELKGARSLGMRDLTLTVEDNAMGEAIKAQWSVMRPEGASEAEAEEAILLAAIESELAAGRSHTATFWRESEGKALHDLPEKKASAAMKRLRAAKKVESLAMDASGKVVVYAHVFPVSTVKKGLFSGNDDVRFGQNGLPEGALGASDDCDDESEVRATNLARGFENAAMELDEVIDTRASSGKPPCPNPRALRAKGTHSYSVPEPSPKGGSRNPQLVNNDLSAKGDCLPSGQSPIEIALAKRGETPTL